MSDEAPLDATEGSPDATEGWVATHAPQLGAIGLPEALWAPLARKLRDGVFDAGEHFTFVDHADAAAADDDDDLAGLASVGGRDRWSVRALAPLGAAADVFLIDHVWLFGDALAAREQLFAVPELRARVRALLAIEGGEDGAAEAADDGDALLAAVAPFAHALIFRGGGGADASAYYVMDELGCRVGCAAAGGARAPNVACAAIADAASGCTFSLLWPVAALGEGDALVRAAQPSLQLIAEGGAAYWERRFEAEAEFDWYCPWEAIAERVLCRVPDDAPATVVVAGNGDSPLPVRARAARPRARVVAVDYVASVTARMEAAHAGSGVEWARGDLTDFASFGFGAADGERRCDLIIDKGGLDAMLVKPLAERRDARDTWVVAPEGTRDARAYLREAARALRARDGDGRGGALALVTLGRRALREPLLNAAGLRVEAWEKIEPTESMLRGEHNDVGHDALALVIAVPDDAASAAMPPPPPG